MSINTYYLKGEEAKDIFELLGIKPGESIDTTPSLNDYKAKVFHR
ncbi:MAG: hypothetical protein WC606_03645 [Candidatus Absconditabacterales bacterium]